MSEKILYNFASRSRPEKLIACLENITQLSRYPKFQIIVTADIDDETMTSPSIRDKVMSFPNTKIFYGTSTGKIDAINKNVSLADPDWSILVNMSDDFVFINDGFDLGIIKDMEEHFKNTDGFLHYPDGSPAKDLLCTMSIIGRMYYERFGYIYHPEYESVYADNEATVVAKNLGKYIFINRQFFCHLHPAWGLAVVDDLYKRNEDKIIYSKDHKTFIKRQRLNFN